MHKLNFRGAFVLNRRVDIVASTSTPTTRCQLDGVALWSITARSSQHGRVLAEKGPSEDLSGTRLTVRFSQVAVYVGDMFNPKNFNWRGAASTENSTARR